MSYTTKLKDHQLAVLEPITKRIDELRSGESFALRDSEKNVDQLRHLIYSFLYLMGIKPYFVLKRETPTQLRILRKAEPAPTIIEDSQSRKAAEFVADNLLQIDDEATAIAVAKESTDDVVFVSEILEEWRRMRGE